MSILLHVNRLLRRLSLVGFLAASLLLLFIGLMGTADIVLTNLFNRPIPGVVELSGALLAVTVFLGLAEAQARGSHIVIDVATAAMRPRMHKLAAMFSLSMGLVFMGFVAWQTTGLAIKAYGYGELALGALPFPLTPFKALAAFGAWLSAAEFARQLAIRVVTPPDTPVSSGPEGSDNA
ncbi:TRAP transporter small permease [uncultured Devosia sp.]|uniref:TRAP transporter small permease n=1 Tax=uncultured Devosia sp. TaxID=211434 RepID=UPI00262A92E9|nr:TRAP transporter small permease [uncultured Devosia sp.]